MIYVTLRQPPMYHQMTLEEFLFQTTTGPIVVNENMANTRTFCLDSLSYRFERKLGFNPATLILKLEEFNRQTEQLRGVPRPELYREFYIPKKSGGLRRIDEPVSSLMNALRQLKTILEEDFNALYHTSAFAYVRHRSTLDAVKRHQANESKWFAKFDLSNFFGSTTLDFVLTMLSMIYPFSELMRYERGKAALETALELAFLNGGLPQGTPLSPMLTNLIMIPIDHALSNDLREFNKQRFVYTRYADDFLISSRYDFDWRAIQQHIIDTLDRFHAPFTIKKEKTRYGSSAGSNWNLGIMLNKDNQMTVGYKKKRQFKAMLTSFVLDTTNGKRWSIDDIQQMDGYRNYYRMVEKSTIDEIVRHIGEKYHVDVVKLIKEQLRST